jgi:hypothetical protein
MPRDKQYYAEQLEELLSTFTHNEQARLRDFRNHLNTVISSLLNGLSVMASGKVVLKQDIFFSLFIESLKTIPLAGNLVSKTISLAMSQYQELQAQRLNSVLGNSTNKDDIAEIFSNQAVIYHHARILSSELELTQPALMLASVKAAAQVIAHKYLSAIQLSPVQSALLDELLTGLMQSLNLAVEAHQAHDLAVEELGDYLAQHIVRVSQLPLTHDFMAAGNFNHLNTTQRYPIAQDALRLSLLAYEDKADIAAIAQQWGYNIKKSDSFFYHFNQGHRCIILANKDTALLIFKSASDLLSNLSTSLYLNKKSIPGLGEIHNGFANALDSLWDGKEGISDRLLYHAKFPPKRFIFTGHAGGAALALLAGARFHQDYKQHQDKITVFTFAQPRVGNNLAKDFAKNVYRFVHPDDPIPSMPPESLGYTHIGAAYSLSDSTEAFNWEDVSATPSPLGTNPSAHSLLEYQNRLTAHEKNNNNFVSPQIANAAFEDAQRLGEMVFHPSFTSQALPEQLKNLNALSIALSQALITTGGSGFTHSIKDNFVQLKLLLQTYTQHNQREHIHALVRVRLWQNLAAYQKKDEATLSQLFKLLKKIQAQPDNKELAQDLELQLKILEDNAQAVLEDNALAPLVVIDACLQMPTLPIHAIDKLRDLLSTHPLMNVTARIRMLDLLLARAQVTKDILPSLLAQGHSLDLTHWIYQPLPAIAQDPEVKDYLQRVLNALSNIEKNNPFLQSLIKANQAANDANTVLLQTLKDISEDEILTPLIRLNALQAKQAIQLLTYVQPPSNALESTDKESDAIDLSPNSTQLTYEDHNALGELALLAKEPAIAKAAFIQAYRCIQAHPDKANLQAMEQKALRKIISLLWQEANATHNAWSKTLIYQEILRYEPTHQGAITALFEQGLGDAYQDFEKHLQAIGTKINASDINNELSKDAVILQTPFNGTWILNQPAIDALHKRSSVRGSTHKVANLGPLYIKEDPGAVGLAFAAWALSRWLFLGLQKDGEWGFVPAQPAKILIKGKEPIIVQLSPAIAGDNLQELLDNDLDPESLKKIDAQQFSVLVIASILLNMYDARDANFILKNSKLTSVDNDTILGRNEIEPGLLTPNILVKNLVFCLAQMQDKIDPEVVTHLTQMNFAALSRIRAWLYSLHHYNTMIEANVFQDKADHKKYFERSKANSKVILPVFFDSQGILQPFTKLIQICQALKENPALTHQALFAKVRKELADYYAKSFQQKNNTTLESRLKVMGGLRGVSICTTEKLIIHTLGKPAKTHAEFIQSQHNPNDVLVLLKKLENHEGLLYSIAEEIAKGDVTTFAREQGLQELVLTKLTAKHYKQKEYTAKAHQAFLQALSPDLTRLVIKGNPLLTDSELMFLINKMPNLSSITLEDCPQLTGFARSVLAYDWLTELCKRQVTEIKLVDCPQLHPALLKTLPKLWQTYPAVHFDMPNVPPTWLGPDLVAVAKKYPQEGLLIPWLAYMAKRKAEELSNNHEEEVRRTSFDSDAGSQSADRQIKIWDKNGRLVRTLTADSGADYALAITTDGDFFSNSQDAAIQRMALSYQLTYEDLLSQFLETHGKSLPYNAATLLHRRQLRSADASLLFPADLAHLGLSATPLADAFLVIYSRYLPTEMSVIAALLCHPACHAHKLTLTRAAYDDADAATLERGLLHRILKQDEMIGSFITQLVIKDNNMSASMQERLRSIIVLNQQLMALQSPGANLHLRLPFMFAALAHAVIALIKDKRLPITSIAIDNIEPGTENLTEEINSLVAVNGAIAHIAEQKSKVTQLTLVTPRLYSSALNKLFDYLKDHPEIVSLELVCDEIDVTTTEFLLAFLNSTHSHRTCNINGAKIPSGISVSGKNKITFNPSLPTLATDLIEKLKSNKLHQAAVCLRLYASRADVDAIDTLLNKIFDDSTNDNDLFTQFLELPQGYGIAAIPLNEHQLFAKFLSLPQGLHLLKASLLASTRFNTYLKINRLVLFVSAVTENMPLFSYLIELRRSGNELTDVKLILQEALRLGKSAAFLNYTEEDYKAVEQSAPARTSTNIIPAYSARIFTTSPATKYSKVGVAVAQIEPNKYLRKWLAKPSRELRWNMLDYGAFESAAKDAFDAAGRKPFIFELLEKLFKSGGFGTYLYLEHLGLLDLNLEPLFQVGAGEHTKTLHDLLKITDSNGDTYLHYLAANFAKSTAYKKTLIVHAMMWVIKCYDTDCALRKMKNKRGEYPFELCDSVLLQYVYENGLYPNEKIDLSAGMKRMPKHHSAEIHNLKQDLVPIVRGPLRLMLELKQGVRLYFTQNDNKDHYFSQKEKDFLTAFNDIFTEYKIYPMTDLKGDPERDEIYLDEKGAYKLCDSFGVVITKQLDPKAIDLSDLDKKLPDPNFKEAFLKCAKKIGHTLKDLKEKQAALIQLSSEYCHNNFIQTYVTGNLASVLNNIIWHLDHGATDHYQMLAQPTANSAGPTVTTAPAQQQEKEKEGQGEEKAIQETEKIIQETEKITREKEKATQGKEKALQAAAAERERKEKAEKQIEELIAQQQTSQATGVNTNSNTGSSSSSSANPPVSMGSSVLTGFQAATGVSSRSASPIPVADINAADIDPDADAKKQMGSVYTVTI